MSKIARDTYKDTLKPKHPYLVQKVVNAAMIAVPGRDSFMQSFIAEQSRLQNRKMNYEDAYAELGELAKWSQLMADKLLLTCK